MIALKFLLLILGIGIFGSAGALVVYDVVIAAQLRRILERSAKISALSSNSALRGNALVPERWRRVATPV
jgi:hypothetical protein